MRIPMREHHKDQLLDVFFFYADTAARLHLMREVPDAYNAWLEANGRLPVVVVVHTSDNQPVREP